MGRKELSRPQRLVDKYGKDFDIWSYSKVGCYKNCHHEFYLARILKKESKNNLYAILGSLSHQQLEDFYNGKIKYEDMLKEFESSFLDYEMADLRFVKDDSQNEKMIKKYKESMIHFFNNHIPITQKVLSEREVWVDTGLAVFIGYVDAIHKDEDGFYNITDYKTSSMGAEYKGENLLHKQEQLLLYALALAQLGIPLETIKIRWNFLKYTNIRYDHMVSVTYMKNEKLTTSTMRKEEMIKKLSPQLKKDILEVYTNLTTKELKYIIEKLAEEGDLSSLPEEVVSKYEINPVVRCGERHRWVEAIKTQLKKDMIAYGMSDVEAEVAYADCLSNNNLDTLPKDISKNYILEDAYVYGEVSQENVDTLIYNMNKAVLDIQAKGEDSSNWENNKLENDKTAYYCNNLCGVNKDCKYHRQYIDDLKKQNEEYKKEESDILAELDML
nr:MAG TPA: PD-(D/E)XK nuclease superfamily protein [Caudoviricetes sp.]